MADNLIEVTQEQAAKIAEAGGWVCEVKNSKGEASYFAERRAYSKFREEAN